MSDERDEIILRFATEPVQSADAMIKLQKEFLILQRRLEIADPDGETIDMVDEEVS